MDIKYDNEEWIEVPLDEQIARKLMRLTKEELIKRYAVSVCEN